MLLKKVRIHKYKSFLTEQSYEVEPQITRIVGKNESGKTALLEALAKSNYFEDNTEFRFNKDLDYPRSELIKVRNENPPALTCEYELSDEDISCVETAFAKGIIPRKNFCVTSFYDNTSKASGVEIDFTVFKDWLISFFGVGDQGKQLIRAADSFSSLESVVSENAELPAMEQIQAQLGEIKTGAGDFENRLEGYIYNTYLSPEIPKLWYFSDYFSLPCRINLNDFSTGQPTNNLSREEVKIANALFELSGLRVSDIQNESNFEAFKAQLEATSNSITDDMFEYWTTNQNLEIRFEIEHAPNGVRYLNIRIYNSKHRVTLPLKNRSKGFLWFFSFLVWFSKIQGDKKSKYILLLDEPGLSLHASAQNDLLRFIDEKLAPEYPIIRDILEYRQLAKLKSTYADGLGNVIGNAVASMNLPIVVLAFIIAVLVRISVGSATVAMTMAAGIVAALPGISELSPLYLACTVAAVAGGSTVCSHFNDSGFWLVGSLLEIDEKSTLKSWTIMETIIGVVGLVCALVISIFA